MAAANVIAKACQEDQPLDQTILSEVQRRRDKPTRRMQSLQVIAQNRVISKTLETSGELPKIPKVVRWLLRFRLIRNIPARIIGYGLGREQVDTTTFRF